MGDILLIIGGAGILAYAAIILRKVWKMVTVKDLEDAQKSKGVKWAEKRLGHPLRQNDHHEYLVCEDELDRIVRSPWRSLFVFLASALVTAVFSSILRWLGS